MEPLNLPIPGWDFLSLVRKGEGPACGIVAIHREALELKAFPARAVLVHNHPDLHARLYRQGATLSNMEFFQFHPAFVSGAESPFCLGDLPLKAGGRFWAAKNEKPWYFLEEIYSDYGNKVPQLVVNRTLHKIGHDLGQVFLDLMAVHPTPELKTLFARVRRRVKIDPARESIPVEPDFNRLLGGLWADNRGMTSIPGLFTNPDAAENWSGQVETGTLFEEEIRLWHSRIKQLFEAGGPENVYRLRGEMKQCFKDSMGLARDNRRLKKAIDEMTELSRRCSQISLADRSRWANRELLLALSFPAQVEAVRASLASALLRNESRDEHYKPEFPQRDDNKFLKMTKATWSFQGPQIEYEDVKNLF